MRYSHLKENPLITAAGSARPVPDGARLNLEVPVTMARARRADRGERRAGATL